MEETYKIRDLEQVRLLSDPLKLELLQAFAEGEKTTKDAAAALGESVTKLYRHVDALFDAGLLEIVQETRKRGTVERTFRAVAKRFEADHSLFQGEQAADGQTAVRNLLRSGEAEILAALANTDPDGDAGMVLTRFHIKGSPERIAQLQRELGDWLESVQSVEEDDAATVEEAGALIAFYPIAGGKSDASDER